MGSGALGWQGHPGTLSFAGQTWSPASRFPPASPAVSGRQEGTGSCFGVLQGWRTGSSHAGCICRVDQLSTADTSTPGSRQGAAALGHSTVWGGEGVPLGLALHPSPAAHQCQCHKGILPAGTRTLPSSPPAASSPSPGACQRCMSQSKVLGSFQR